MGFARELPEEKRQKYFDDMKMAKEKLRPLRQELRTSWDQANQQLGEEPFDKSKFKASLDRVAETERQFRLQIYAVIADAAEKMSAPERKAFQKWRESRSHRYFRGHRRGDKDDDD